MWGRLVTCGRLAIGLLKLSRNQQQADFQSAAGCHPAPQTTVCGRLRAFVFSPVWVVCELHAAECYFAFLGLAFSTTCISSFRGLVKRHKTRPSESNETMAGGLTDVSIQPAGKATASYGRPTVRSQNNPPPTIL